MEKERDIIDAIRYWGFITLGILLFVNVSYTFIIGTYEIYKQVAMVLAFLLPAALLDRPLWKAATPSGKWVSLLLDLALAVTAALIAGYIFFEFSEMQQRIRTFQTGPAELVVGTTLAALLIEGARRYIGLPLLILTIAFVLYAGFSELLPGALRGIAMDLEGFNNAVLLGSNGVFGPALRVTAVEIYAFILFGATLEALRGGDLFMRIATALTRKQYGGPAKAAVVGSSLMGTISGSAVANVVISGSVTIPMMKRAGFKPHVAASIEAVASTGGQIMPPLMGATAFVIAAYTGLPYATVAIHATIPAILFYVAVFLNVHLLSLREDIRPIEQSQSWTRTDLFAGVAVFTPLVLLVYLLITYFPPMLSAFYSAGLLVVTTLPIAHMRISIAKFIQAITSLTRAMSVIAVACGTAGIVMGIILQTGLGANLSSLLLQAAGGNVYILAVLTAAVSIILGMGLPTIVVYILLASLVAPALIDGGFETLAVHLFVFYYGVVALLTPPLAVASYAAAGIAETDPTRTAFFAAKFALAKYVVPFVFLFSPALVAEGPLWLIAVKVLLALVALIGLSLAIIGYWRGFIPAWQRIAFVGVAALLGSAPLELNAVGLAGAAVCMGMLYMDTRRARPAHNEE